MKYMISFFTPNTLVTKICLLCLIKLFLSISLIGETIQFSLHDGSALTDVGASFDNKDSISSFTQDGITLSMEALLDDNSALAELNGGAEGFGVNSDGLSDYTQRIDNTNGQEMIIFSFDSPGILDTVDLRYIEESSNEAILSFEGGKQFSLNTETAFSGKDDFKINEAFLAGQQISLYISPLASENENFALESISIKIPENNASILGMLAFILLFVSLRSTFSAFDD
ncbi:MAG: hypothetical protein ACJZ8T_00860 [Coraliomargaritaceae bacterium]|jgi:hypothetical protein